MITDNDAVRLQQFDRRSARVEAMRLDDVAAVYEAHQWVRAHGLPGWPGNLGETLYIWGPGGTYVEAHLGQWLTFDPATGAFEVYDDGEFQTAHNAVTGVADV